MDESNNWNKFSFYRIIGSCAVGIVNFVVILSIGWFTFFPIIKKYGNSLKHFSALIDIIFLIIAFLVGDTFTSFGEAWVRIFFLPDNKKSDNKTFENVSYRYSDKRTLSWKDFVNSIGYPLFDYSEFYFQLSRFLGEIMWTGLFLWFTLGMLLFEGMIIQQLLILIPTITFIIISIIIFLKKREEFKNIIYLFFILADIVLIFYPHLHNSNSTVYVNNVTKMMLVVNSIFIIGGGWMAIVSREFGNNIIYHSIK
ncbi:MAG: hypothetical protein ACYDB5_10545 [bacterium]